MNAIQKIRQAIGEERLWNSVRELSKDDYLKMDGSVDTDIYWIQEGCLRVFVYSEAEEHTIRFAYQNDFMVALDSFFFERPSNLCFQALRKTTVKVLHKSTFEEWVNRSFEHLKSWNEVLQALVVDQLEREQDLLVSSPQERYQRVLARSPQLFQEVPHKYIANYLRMTPETLSRVKKG